MKTKLLLGTIVALIALSLLGGTALAAEPADRLRGLGKVAAVDLGAGTLTVDTRRGEVTVYTDAATAFRIPGMEEPSLADVQVGDLVAGIVERQEDAALLAHLIAVVPPNPERVRGWGRVEAIHGKTLIIENRQGTFEVHTDEDTVFRIRGVDDPSIKDIQVYDLVAGVATRQEDGTLLAKLVAVVPSRLRRIRALGRVEAVHGKTLVVENRRGTFEVHTDKDTIFRIRGVEDPTIVDIEVGDLVAGKVTKQDDETVLAKLIAVVPPKPERVRGLGRVQAIHGKTVVVENRRGTFEVHTDKDTIFRIRGVEDPSIVDVEVGDLVAGKVIKETDGTLLARLIAVVPPKNEEAP